MLLSMIIVWNDDYLSWQTFAIKNSIAANVCLVNSQNFQNFHQRGKKSKTSESIMDSEVCTVGRPNIPGLV